MSGWICCAIENRKRGYIEDAFFESIKSSHSFKQPGEKCTEQSVVGPNSECLKFIGKDLRRGVGVCITKIRATVV